MLKINYQGYAHHHTFMFTATFFELVDNGSRLPTIYAPPIPYENGRPRAKFGSFCEGPFAPFNSIKTQKIRQTTLSLVFNSMRTGEGTYWTITSIGQYSDEKAFEKPRNFKAEEVARYTAPEEVFLDKLARVIDWAVDDGMMNVLSQLELELAIPVGISLAVCYFSNVC